MRFWILIVLVVAILAAAQAGQVLIASILALLLIADIFGGLIAKTISFFLGVGKGIAETGKAEAAEVEAAKTKYPSGRKFFEESFSRTGKAIGKGEKAKKDEKDIADKRPDPEKVVTAVSDFLAGLGKAFKK